MQILDVLEINVGKGTGQERIDMSPRFDEIPFGSARNCDNKLQTGAWIITKEAFDRSVVSWKQSIVK